MAAYGSLKLVSSYLRGESIVTADYENKVFFACQSVVASELSSGAALLDMRAGKYYSLNVVGAHIWNCIQTPASLQSLVASISDKFAVGLDDCRRDVCALLASLMSAGLVEAKSVEADEAVG